MVHLVTHVPAEGAGTREQARGMKPLLTGTENVCQTSQKHLSLSVSYFSKASSLRGHSAKGHREGPGCHPGFGFSAFCEPRSQRLTYPISLRCAISASFFLKRARILFLIFNRTFVLQIGTLGPGGMSLNPLPGILGEPLHKPKELYEGLRQKTGIFPCFKTRLFPLMEVSSMTLLGALPVRLTLVARASDTGRVPHRWLPVFTE